MLRVNPMPAPSEIREAREQLALTQDDLAERLGVSRRTVQNWEAGNQPQPRHRRLLADFMREYKEAAA